MPQRLLKYIEAVRLVRADACGVPEVGANNMLVIRPAAVRTTENVDEGTDELKRNAAGEVCVDDPADPQLVAGDITLENCGLCPELDSFLTGSRAILDGSDQTGFGRADFDTSVVVIVEVLYRLPADACAGGTASVMSELYTFTNKWRTSGEKAADGSTTIPFTYAGKYKKGTQFDPTVVAELEHWEDDWDADDWFSTNVFPTAIVPEVIGCQPQATTAGGS